MTIFSVRAASFSVLSMLLLGSPCGDFSSRLDASPPQEKKTDEELLNQAQSLFTPLPQPGGSGADSASSEVVELGRKLFFDPRISADGVRSCALCHQPSLYGTDGLPLSRGVDNKLLARNAPTILNSASQFRIHWDGHFESVEAQAQGALLGPAFHNPTTVVAEARIQSIPGYAELFHSAFPDQQQPVTTENWGRAIGAYERTLVTPSRFDDFLRGKPDALNAAEIRGLRIFMETGCADCHSGVLLGGQSYEKFGVTEDYWKETHSAAVDKGRFLITHKDADLYVFKVAPLRNIARTPPYFHDGSVASLHDAVQIMASVQLGTRLKPEEVQDIVTFLESLTGSLPENFADVPVLPTGAFKSQP